MCGTCDVMTVVDTKNVIFSEEFLAQSYNNRHKNHRKVFFNQKSIDFIEKYDFEKLC